MAPQIHFKGKALYKRERTIQRGAEFLLGELTDTALHRMYASEEKPCKEHGQQGVGWH